MANHNDVFNDNVIAYLAAVVSEARYKLTLYSNSVDDRLIPECQGNDFERCFDAQQEFFKSLKNKENSATPPEESRSCRERV